MTKEICFSTIISRKLLSPRPYHFLLNKYLKCFILKAGQIMSPPGVPTCLPGPGFREELEPPPQIWLGGQREGQKRSTRAESGSGQQPSLLEGLGARMELHGFLDFSRAAQGFPGSPARRCSSNHVLCDIQFPTVLCVLPRRGWQKRRWTFPSWVNTE